MYVALSYRIPDQEARACTQPVISEFSEVLRLFGEFAYTGRAINRSYFQIPH
jgi:hypothetical protein